MVLTIGFAGLAGCTEEAGDTGSVDGVGTVDFEDPNAIPIVGRVVNDEVLPIPDVDVQLDPSAQVATTDEAGNFKLAVLKEGTYKFTIAKLGYEPFEQDVKVPKGGLTDVMLVLKPTPDGVPYTETNIYNTYMFCNSPIGGGCFLINTITSTNYLPEDNPDFLWEVPNRGLKEMRFESQWTSGVPDSVGNSTFIARNPGALFLGCNSTTANFEDTERYYSGPEGRSSQSPAQFWVKAGKINAEVGACHEFVGDQGFQVWQTTRPDRRSPYPAPLDVRTEIWLTFFFWAPSEDRNFSIMLEE